MEEFAQLLTNYAFPVVVSLYLLTRLEKRIGDLEKAIINLANKIEEVKDDIRNGSLKRSR
jgi:hypothetical protein